MLIDRPLMSTYRSSCGLATFITAYKAFQPQMSSNKLYSMFLNDSKLLKYKVCYSAFKDEMKHPWLSISHLFSYSTARPNLIGAEIGSFSSRVSTTPSAGATSSVTQPQTSQTDDDIPDWKRAMLERQAARNREAAAYSTSSTTSTQSKLYLFSLNRWNTKFYCKLYSF